MVRSSGFEPPRGQPPLAPEASASAVSPRPQKLNPQKGDFEINGAVDGT